MDYATSRKHWLSSLCCGLTRGCSRAATKIITLVKRVTYLGSVRHANGDPSSAVCPSAQRAKQQIIRIRPLLNSLTQCENDPGAVTENCSMKYVKVLAKNARIRVWTLFGIFPWKSNQQGRIADKFSLAQDNQWKVAICGAAAGLGLMSLRVFDC